MRSIVQLCSTHAGDRKRNEEYLSRCLADSIRRGEAPFAPHAIYPRVLDDENPEERSLGFECAKSYFFAASTVVFYIDYGYSKGMLVELKLARELDIPILERSIL